MGTETCCESKGNMNEINNQTPNQNINNYGNINENNRNNLLNSQTKNNYENINENNGNNLLNTQTRSINYESLKGKEIAQNELDNIQIANTDDKPSDLERHVSLGSSINIDSSKDQSSFNKNTKRNLYNSTGSSLYQEANLSSNKLNYNKKINLIL